MQQYDHLKHKKFKGVCFWLEGFAKFIVNNKVDLMMVHMKKITLILNSFEHIHWAIKGNSSWDSPWHAMSLLFSLIAIWKK